MATVKSRTQYLFLKGRERKENKNKMLKKLVTDKASQGLGAQAWIDHMSLVL